MNADSKMLLTACDDMHSHLYDVEHASLIEAFSGESVILSLLPQQSFHILQPGSCCATREHSIELQGTSRGC